VLAVAKPTAPSDTHPVIRWLMTDARRRVDADDLLGAFANELRAAGVDVSGITTGVPTPHPQIFSRRADRSAQLLLWMQDHLAHRLPAGEHFQRIGGLGQWEGAIDMG
jgi:hypothetical protein